MAVPIDAATERFSHEVIGCAIEVHRELGGPGLLEEVYEQALAVEFGLRGVPFERQKRLPVVYKGEPLGKTYVLDLLVGGCLVVECKATVEDHPVFRSQCLTQLHLTNLQLGLVVNFGQRTVKQGVHRVVNPRYRPPLAR